MDTLALLNQLDFFDLDMVIMMAKSLALDIKYDYVVAKSSKFTPLLHPDYVF